MKKIVFNVKANKEIFNNWDDLDNPFVHMNNIIQNDQEITPKQLEDWMSEYIGMRDRFAKKLDKLFSETIAYVRSCEKM